LSSAIVQAVSSIRIPTLDGWRGIAILLVLVDHLQPLRYGQPTNIWTNWIGQHGVTVFFVLSGFLITTKLMQEQAATGHIRLGRFYLRRCFRLMPCAWTYLLFVLLIRGATFTTSGEFASCILFFRNSLTLEGFPTTLHFWSLSIEEQFYLVWPALLLLAGAQRARWAALALASIVAVFRLLTWHSTIDQPIVASFATALRADALLIGCATALFQNDPRVRKAVQAIPGPAVLGAIVLCLYFFHRFIPLGESIMVAVLILRTSMGGFPTVGKFLEWRPLATLGVMSYSIYVWQGFAAELEARNLHRLPLVLLGLAVVSTCSYYGIEKPFIRIGRSLESKPDHMPAAAVMES